MAIQKIVVAYSGGLDTSVMVKWLANKFDAEIIAVTGNLGQTKEIIGLKEKALSTGASKFYMVDLRNEFILNYVWPALKAGAMYEGTYPMATAIGRPLLAKLMVDIAIKEGADTIAHGCTGKGNDQVRFELAIQTLAPQLNILAPLRTWEFKSREEEMEYALEQGIPINVTKDSPYSIDENLWGVAVECGSLEDPSTAPPEDAFQITNDPKNTPHQSDQIILNFEEGVPVAVNGRIMAPEDLVEYLNKIGGKHGIGRIDMIENRVVGIKSREIYEAPAATILHFAHKELEKLILDRETFRYKSDVSNKFANMIYDGLWYTPLFSALNAFVNETQKSLTGEIKLELYKGNLIILSRTSKNSLYNHELATYSSDDSFDHIASEGFIKIYGLPYKTMSQLQIENNKIEVA